jgi:uncharacterized membrane protein required for colicin V production
MLPLSLFESLKIGFAISKIGFIDIGVVLALVGGAVIGYTRGLAEQITKFIALIVTTVVTLHYYERVAALITSNSIVPPVIATVLTFILLAAITNVVSKIILMVFSKLITIQFVYFIERFFGSLIGAIRFLIICGMISIAASLLSLPAVDNLFKVDSISGPVLIKICPYVHDYSVYFTNAMVSGFKREQKPQS